jgi:hypothetical protein
METRVLFLRGSVRWRDWSFWLVLAIYAAFCVRNFYNGESWWPILLWLPFYLFLLSPHLLWLGPNWLLLKGPFSTFQRFDQIQHYSISDYFPASSDVFVILTLHVKTKQQNVSLYIQPGKSLEGFLNAMKERQVPTLEQSIRAIFADTTSFHSDFVTPFSNVEAERDALYKLLGRAKPELKS